jgi:hypothetical protein
MLLLFCTGVVLAGVTYFWLTGGFPFAESRGPVLAGVLAVAVLMECFLVGIVLAGKRAVATALIHALRARHLGRVTVRLLFERLLGVAADQPLGQRGGVVAQAAERVPLAQLEKRVNEAIRDVLGGEAAGGGFTSWLRRRIRRQLLGIVRKYTLARFREADAQYGGVDLAAVQSELESSIDDRLIRKLKHGIDLWTAAVLAFLVVQVCLGNYLLTCFAR